MKYDAIVETMNTDPVVQGLLNSAIPARLAYNGLDNKPRVVPVSYLWDGANFVFASSPDWYKIKSIAVNPEVALTVDTTDFPPMILSVRGVAAIEYDQGLPEEYIEASRRIVGEELMPQWEENVRSEHRNMAIVRVKPTWIKVVDFDTRFPGPDQPV
jgi:Pyridoxamine 5'-phosphate oxidase